MAPRFDLLNLPPLQAVRPQERSASNDALKAPPVPVTEQSDTPSSEDEDESSQLYDLANSILDECNGSSPLSELDTAIYLFREALNKPPASHPPRSHLLKGLAGALITRFSLTKQHEDLDKSWPLRGGIQHDGAEVLTGTEGKSHLNMNTSTESSELNKLANTILANFNQSAQLSSLNTAVLIHRQALLLRPIPHGLRAASLDGLAAALYARFRRTDNMSNLDEAILLLHAAVEACPAPHGYHADLTNNLSAVLITRFDKTGQLSDLHAAMERHHHMLQDNDTNDVEKANQLFTLAANLLNRVQHSANITDLERAISLMREVLALLPVHHPNRSPACSNLAVALSTRFKQSGQREDLYKAISCHRETLELRPAPHLDRPITLSNLGDALETQFEQFGQQQDLDEAILLHRDALKLQPAPHPHRSISLNNLANALRTQFNQSGQQKDLDEAISCNQEALGLRPVPHPLRSSSLNNFASALWTRFSQSGQQKDLDKAISFSRQALELRPAPHPLRSISMNNLAGMLRTRFDHLGQREELDEAISYHQQALELQPSTHPGRCSSLNNLAGALTTRFEQSGQREDLDEAVACNQQALELRTALHPDNPMSLNNLANALKTRFEQSGQREDLDKAILFNRQALKLRPAPHPLRCSSLNNLANALLTSFERSGQRDDLDEAILFNRQALELRPALHPLRSSSLNNLAHALTTRFEQSGQQEDLAKAILFNRQALELRPALHPLRSSSLNNLANALTKRTGQRKDVDEAILFHQQALELRPAPHHFRSSSLHNLANTLMKRSEQPGKWEDLDRAILLNRQALELRLAPHPLRSSSLHNLANALRTRFEHSNQWDDLDMAIKKYYESLDALVSGHPKICLYSADLGRALIHAYSNTRDSQYLDRAMHAFRAAVTCTAAPASERFRAAKSWAHHADSNHKSSLDAYQAAMELLPRLAMLGLDLQSRQQALTSGSDGLARDAAACAIRSTQYEKAVELLEEGRAVFWSQALQLRTPMVDLRDAAPVLEDKLRCISIALEQGSLRDVSRNLESDSPQKVMSIEEEASHFRRLNDDWLATLEKVRRLDGFQDFLRPSRLPTLQHAADKGPVVIVNASETGCAALIMTPAGVQHVPFPGLSFFKVTKLVKILRTAISQDGRDALLLDSNRADVEDLIQQMPFISDAVQLLRLSFERHVRRAPGTSARLNGFQFVLNVLWISVVEPVVRTLGLERAAVPPNLWWCPTGPFAFLPLHAAGQYHTEEPESVSDYVISSYTPTIKALLGDVPVHNDSFKMMVVIQSETPGQRSLPYTLEELRKIETHVPEEELVKLVSGSVQDVMLNLPATSIAHFACHGHQNSQNPLESALLLKDGPLKVSQIMRQSIPHGSLAFLSACQTAMGDENLPDEVIHLGATLLFAGFRGVVATMWSIADVDGPKVADTFYENIFDEASSDTTNSSGPDTTRAARALHYAVIKLRSENVSFARWVPFIHLGR